MISLTASAALGQILLEAVEFSLTAVACRRRKGKGGKATKQLSLQRMPAISCSALVNKSGTVAQKVCMAFLRPKCQLVRTGPGGREQELALSPEGVKARTGPPMIGGCQEQSSLSCARSHWQTEAGRPLSLSRGSDRLVHLRGISKLTHQPGGGPQQGVEPEHDGRECRVEQRQSQQSGESCRRAQGATCPHGTVILWGQACNRSRQSHCISYE